MDFLIEVTEENLPKLKDRYYKFGSAELQIGDKIVFIMIGNEAENGDRLISIRSCVVGSDSFLHLLTDKK